MVDFAVNVYPADPPDWLGTALRGSLSEFGSYPDPGVAERELAAYHGREDGSVLATAGAAEAFGLLARFRAWSRPTVIHPQFTEPHAALLQAGHQVDEVRLSPADGYRLDPAAIPAAADLVVIGNPTNPTGVLHPAEAILGLCRPGRLVVVDEAFIDTVPGEIGSLATQAGHGLVVIRSLTKQWAIPGVRAGYLLASRDLVAELREDQTPWSVGTTAIAAMRACATEQARHESHRRAVTLAGWRDHLQRGLNALGVDHLPSATSFVLARPGRGIHSALRERGIAVRRADTFPGLESDSIRIAVRPEPRTDRLLAALAEILPSSQRQQPEQHQETS